MIRIVTSAVAFLLVLACSPAAEQPPEPDVFAERLARIEAQLVPGLILAGMEEPPASLAERMEALGVPAISVAMWNEGEIVWAKAWGVADVESGRPATPETLFQAASISKPVAAMGLLALVDQGRVELDQDVNELLSSWQVPANELTEIQPVTLRGLLSHTAGTTVHGFPGYAHDEEIPSTVGVLNGDGNTDAVVVDIAPGKTWRYSGGGYTIAQLLAVDVSGRPFEDLLEEEVLGPLGMTASSYEQPLAESRRDIAATAYRADGSRVETGGHVYPEMAAAGLWTTPSDLAAFAMAIQRAQAGEEHPVLSSETVAVMLQRHIGDYGLGLGLMEDGAYFGHGGANEGFRCNLVAVSNGNSGVAIMTNSDRGGALSREVLFSVAREEGWEGFEPRVQTVVTLSDDQQRGLAGRYGTEGPPGVVRIYFEEGEMYVVSEWDDDASRFLAESDSLIFDPDSGFRVAVEWDGDRAKTLRVNDLEFRRLD